MLGDKLNEQLQAYITEMHHMGLVLNTSVLSHCSCKRIDFRPRQQLVK